MKDQNDGNGPSWKWIVNAILTITVPIITAGVLWIGTVLYDLSASLPTVQEKVADATQQLVEIRNQVNVLATQLTNNQLEAERSLAKLSADYDALHERVDQLESTNSRLSNATQRQQKWIEAHALADSAIREAREGEGHKQRFPSRGDTD